MPVVLDGQMLANSELRTWCTDAGDFDVLADIPDRTGRRVGYEELVERAEVDVIDRCECSCRVTRGRDRIEGVR